MAQDAGFLGFALRHLPFRMMFSSILLELLTIRRLFLLHRVRVMDLPLRNP